MLKSELLVEELEKLRTKLYADQPQMMVAINSLINLLQYSICDHVWECRRQGGAPDDEGSEEMVVVCETCGGEKMYDDDRPSHL